MVVCGEAESTNKWGVAMIKTYLESLQGEPVFMVYHDTKTGMRLKIPVKREQQWCIFVILPPELFDDRGFRPIPMPYGRKVILACPKGFYNPQTRMCRNTALTVHAIFYPRKERYALIDEFMNGDLQRRHMGIIRRFMQKTGIRGKA